MKFELIKESTEVRARIGKLYTAHGIVNTPVFMPVGTQGTVKTVSSEELVSLDVEIILGNTYHLYFRPGVEVIKEAGGLHRFVNWQKPILTDSGGFQVFSLSGLNEITDTGVEFKNPADGSKHLFTAEKAVDLQLSFGADIIMSFDDCTPYPCTEPYAWQSMNRTLSWALRGKEYFIEHKSDDRSALFGIVQGSVYPSLRAECINRLLDIGFDGYALGGLSVGEPKNVMYEVVNFCTDKLPPTQPRYLMGVGTPEDLWACIELGIDMFDCVQPTRNARNAQSFTYSGKLNLRNSKFRTDFQPIDSECTCPVCRNYTRAYLCHLFRAGELLALRLNTIHNLHFMVQLIKLIRESIVTNTFQETKTAFLSRYLKGGTLLL